MSFLIQLKEFLIFNLWDRIGDIQSHMIRYIMLKPYIVLIIAESEIVK